MICLSKRMSVWGSVGVAWAAAGIVAAEQPPVGSSPSEPRLGALLEQQWHLDIDRDLRNPLAERVAPAALFQRVNPKKAVLFTPIIALGMEATTRGGWYRAGPGAGDLPADVTEARRELWSYAYKQPTSERKTGRYTPPPLESGSVPFDPGDHVFGLWVRNDHFDDQGVFTQPGLVAKVNDRLKAQPYKAMIYPNRDPKKERLVPDSYLICWEYSTNDDFQDVVTRLDNVRLLPADPPLKGILARGAKVRKVAGGFKFSEGPAWDFKKGALYFSDIPQAHIVRYADGRVSVANAESGQSNGLMFDRQGMLIACEHAGRRVSRAIPGQAGSDIVTHYDGKRLNSPNDLWIDAGGGIYFTDPRYGRRDDLEQDAEAVYYIAVGGKITRIIDDLVRPNGIALSPDGKMLYVVDNGADRLYRYPVKGPGQVGKGQRVAYVTHPDGMTVDAQGRLYVTCRGGVWVLEADGKWIGLIETPENPANCTFGGPGYRTLFITACTSLYAVETLTRGWHVHLDGARPPGSSRTRTASGKPEALKKARKQAARRRRRIIMNNDGNDCRQFNPDEPKTIANFLSKRTSPLVGSHVDAIFYCTGVFNLYTHQSEETELLGVGENADWAWAPELIRQGTDALEVTIGFGHAHGLEVFWSMRMNDTHDSAAQHRKLLCQWKRDHPGYLMGKPEDKFRYGGRRWSAVNYGLAEVRDKVFRILKDVCTRYDVDGVELDFFRHPVYFKPQMTGEPVTQARCNQMTGLLRRIRAMTEEVGLNRGRPVLIAVRVPDSIGYAKAIGLDLVRWLADDLIDMIAGSGYFHLEPWENLVRLGGKYDVPVYAVLSASRIVDIGHPETKGDLKQWRGEALNAWQAGVSGIYTFNRFDPTDPIFRELGSLDTLAELESTYQFNAGKAMDYWLKGGSNSVVKAK